MQTMNRIILKLKLRIKKLKNGLTWEEILDHGFSRIALLKKTGEEKAAISINISESLKQTKLYWIEIVLSSLIATFGLLQNSAAVIIGAMLIAPLMQPIQGMAFAVSTGRPKFFWRSARILGISIIVSITLAYLVCLIAPFKTETPEMLGRTAPNLFDLFIAVLSAIVAFLVHGFKRLSESVAGVAMAASLMPPLAVVGIELCFGAFHKSWGSFLLFFTNLVAILLVGAIIFLFYGFNPHEEQSTKTLKRLGIIFSIILVLWIPLHSGLIQIKEKREIELFTKETLSHTLSTLIPEAELKRLNVDSYSKKHIDISGEIKLPEDVSLFTEIINDMNQQMSEKLEKEVTLKLDIIRTASVISKVIKNSDQDNIKKSTRSQIQEAIPNAIILTLDALDLSSEEHPNEWSIKTVYALPSGELLNTETQTSIEKNLSSYFPEKTLKFLWFPVSQRSIAPEKQAKQPSPEELIQQELEQEWNQILKDLSSDSLTIENLKVEWSYLIQPENHSSEETIKTPISGISETTETNDIMNEITASVIKEVNEVLAEVEEAAPEVLKTENTPLIDKKVQISFDVYATRETQSLQGFVEQITKIKAEKSEIQEIEILYRVFEYTQNAVITEDLKLEVPEEESELSLFD